MGFLVFVDISPIIEKMRDNHSELERQLAAPSVFSDRQAYQNLTREHQRLSSLLAAYEQLGKCRREWADNEALLQTEDDLEFKEVIRSDMAALDTEMKRLDTKVLSLILPPQPNDSRNTIMEIRPAAGGDEAALFAGDLFRMYTRFGDRSGWKVERLEMTDTNLGGIKEVAFSLQGEDVYRKMQFESGVHRVQRIPTTDTGGRIHTSTVTVAVLPEAKAIDLQINPEDLRIDVFRSSGPGGQSVNTTDSAVRITHVPSGLNVVSQQEKSQHRNRDIAMRILRSRLLEMMQHEETAKQAAERKSQIGTGDRSERIRTYNYPQNRITDHRFNLSWYNLPAILEGEIEDMIDEIAAVHCSRRLEEELERS